MGLSVSSYARGTGNGTKDFACPFLTMNFDSVTSFTSILVPPT